MPFKEKTLLLFNKTPLFFLLIIFTLLPFSNYLYTTRVHFTFLYIYVPFILFLLIAVCRILLQKDFSFRQNPLFPFFLLWYSVILLSVLQSFFIPDNPSITRLSFLNYPFMKSYVRALFIGSLILFSFLIAQTLRTPKSFIASLSALCFTTTITCLFSVVAFGFSFTRFSFLGSLIITYGTSFHRITGFLPEPGFFGAVLLITIPLSFFLYNQRKNSFWIYSTILQIITLILTFSRAAWLAFIFGLFFVFLVYAYFHKERITLFLKKKKIVLVISIFMLFSISTGFFIAKTVISNSMRWSTLVRLENNIYALEAFTDHPLLGIGYENFAFYSGYRYAPTIFGNPGIYPSINNIILQIFTETGIIGAFIFFTLLYVSIKMVFKHLQDKPIWFYCVIFTGTSLFIHMLFFNLFPFIFLWIWVGFVLLTLEHKEVLNNSQE